MSISKIELRAQIKLLRAQMDNLEVKCKEREDKMLGVILILEPLFDTVTPTMKEAIIKVMK